MRKKANSRIIDNQVITYFVIIAVIIGLVAYASRGVLFRPWTARTRVSAVSDGHLVYIFGGLDRHNLPLEGILRINLEEKKIKQAATLPTPRYAAAAVLSGDTVYLAGGYDNKTYYTEVLAFDTKTNGLTMIAELPEPRCYGGLAVYGNKLYYFGGWNGKRIADTVIEVDLAAGTSKELPGPTEALQFQTALQSGRYLYLYGGETETLQYNRTFYVIDLASLTVVRRCSLPAGLVRSPAAVLEDTVYIAGGWSEGPLKKVFRVRPRAEPPDCTVLGEIPYSCEDTALAAYNNTLYLIGGSEERFKRQLRIVRIDPETLNSDSLLFKSFVWW
jgi:hypothetical protein